MTAPDTAPRAGHPGWLVALALVALLVAVVVDPAQATQDGGTGGGTDAGASTNVLRALPVGGGATADSNGSMIAVTGVDITGQSVLYVIDTEAKQLAAYQASGGAASTQGIKLVGARRIDLDLALEGFNDQTEHDGRPLKYGDLYERFQDGGR